MFLPITKFAFNNAKNVNISYIFFELNCSYYPYVFSEKNNNPHFWPKIVEYLANKVRNLIAICWKKLFLTQKFQKQADNKDVKSLSYIPAENVWLNSKSIKIKKNWILKLKFFKLFQVLHLINN